MQRVHPCMVPAAAPIAKVDGVFNAVVAEGDFVGRSMYEGRGAGAGPSLAPESESASYTSTSTSSARGGMGMGGYPGTGFY